MTPADLPPLPAPADQLNDFFAPDQIHDYAKLAVRQALERAERKCLESLGSDYQAWPIYKTGSQCAFEIRAIIKEYEE